MFPDTVHPAAPACPPYRNITSDTESRIFTKSIQGGARNDPT